MTAEPTLDDLIRNADYHRARKRTRDALRACDDTAATKFLRAIRRRPSLVADVFGLCAFCGAPAHSTPCVRSASDAMHAARAT